MTRAPAELRFLICALLTGTGDPESLANVNTNELPDGAQCYVVSESALFVLKKTSTATAVTSQVLAPGSGPGRWFRETTVVAAGSPVWLQSSGANAFAAPDGNWGASTGSNFVTTALADWALTALGGVLTYTGVSRDFMAVLTMSAQIGNVGAARQIYAAISKNDDLTGVAAAGSSGSQSQAAAVISVPYMVVAQRRLSLATGNTVRVKAAATSGASTLSADALSLSLIPI